MINLDLDTSELSAEFGLDQQAVDDLKQYTVETITSAFALEWGRTASQVLGKTREQYKNAIQVTSRGRFTGVAYLNPQVWIANAIELGADPFDMKEGLLASPNAKQGKNGKYMSIPFRFATPGMIGQSGAFAGVMPADVHRAVLKREKATPSSPGLRTGDIGKKHHMPKSHAYRNRLRAVGFDKMKKGTEATSMYTGLQRNARGSGYVNFRRVSENSDAEAFIHPGIQARNLANQAYDRMDIATEVDQAIDSFLSNMGF